MVTKRVRVLRPFYFDRKVQEIGKSIELPAVFAVEMIAARKAEAVMDPPAPAAPSEPARTEPDGKKGAKDAGK